VDGAEVPSAFCPDLKMKYRPFAAPDFIRFGAFGQDGKTVVTLHNSDDFGNSRRYCRTSDPRFPDRNVAIGWIPVDQNWGGGGPPNGFNVCSTDPAVAMSTNNAELYVTRDGGKTWQCAFDPRDRNRAYICYTDIGFARSEDRGKTWRLSVNGSPWRNTWYQIAFDPQRPGVIYAACSNQHDIPPWMNIEGARGPRRRTLGRCCRDFNRLDLDNERHICRTRLHAHA